MHMCYLQQDNMDLGLENKCMYISQVCNTKINVSYLRNYETI